MKTTLTILLSIVGATTAARIDPQKGNPLSYLHGRPDPTHDEKIRQRIAEYEAEKARIAAGGKPAESPQPPTAAVGKSAGAADAEVAVPRRSGGRGLLKRCATATSVVGLGVGSYYGVQTLRLHGLMARARAEQDELGSSLELPAHEGHVRGKIAAHQELLRRLEQARLDAAEEAVRKVALVGEISAALAQLQKAAPPSSSLQERSEAELRELNASLAARVRASAALLEAYLALGQQPPDDFREWDAARLDARREQLTSKGELLRELLLLQAKLGGARRMDDGLPEVAEAELREKVQAMRAEAAGAQERRAKEVLQGKIEAALWLRKQEVPMGLAAMSLDDMRDLLARLNGKAGAGAGAKSAAAEEA